LLFTFACDLCFLPLLFTFAFYKSKAKANQRQKQIKGKSKSKAKVKLVVLSQKRVSSKQWIVFLLIKKKAT
jgi:hypothetical protein